ncbi:MAG: hypothetical protein KDK36_21490 [Leptospiraceae bacterium]|nr:hypothetical protein [Leptospiraceae bacterium]
MKINEKKFLSRKNTKFNNKLNLSKSKFKDLVDLSYSEFKKDVNLDWDNIKISKNKGSLFKTILPEKIKNKGLKKYPKLFEKQLRQDDRL